MCGPTIKDTAKVEKREEMYDSLTKLGMFGKKGAQYVLMIQDYDGDREFFEFNAPNGAEAKNYVLAHLQMIDEEDANFKIFSRVTGDSTFES